MGRWSWWAPTCWSAACISSCTRWPRPVTGSCGTSWPSPRRHCWRARPCWCRGRCWGDGSRRCCSPAPCWWTGAASISPPGRAAGGCAALDTGPSDTGCSSSWPSANRWSPSGRAPPRRPSARRCCWRPSWAWPPPSACGGCTSTWRRWRPSTECWRRRARLALEAYTYGHFPIVAGIVLTALGVEGVLAHAEEAKPLGGFYAAALFGGAALYLAGYLVFKQRMHGALGLPRLVTVGVLLAALPAAIVLPPLVGLAGLALILAALVT